MSGVMRWWLSARALPNAHRVTAGGVAVGIVVDGVAGAYVVRVAGLHVQAAAACHQTLR